MPRVTEYEPPKLSWGWLPEYPTSGRSFASALRPGQWVGMMPLLAPVPDATYLGCGITHLIQNGGQDNSALPVAQQACMAGNFFTQAISKPFSQWTPDDVRAVVIAHLASRNGGEAFYLSQFMEGIGNTGITTNEGYRNSGLEKHILQQVQIELDKHAGRCHGDYDGHLACSGFASGDTAPYRAALASPQAALALVRNLAPFGNGFYSNNEYQFRHGAIKIYGTGDINTHRVVMAHLTCLELDELTRTALGTDKRVAVVPFQGYDEQLQLEQDRYSITYSHPAGGGVASRTTFPMWSPVHQIWVLFRALSKNFDAYCWSREARFGTNPNVIVRDGYNNFTYSGGSATRGDTVYQYTTDPVPYPTEPYGVEDILPVAGDMLAFIKNFTGGWNQTKTPHRYNSGTLTNASATGYLIDRFEDKLGECYLFRQGNSNYVSVAYCATGLGPNQTAEIQVPMPTGADLVFTAFPGVPRVFNIDLTQAA